MARNRIFYGLFLLAAVVFHSFYTGWFSFFLLLPLCGAAVGMLYLAGQAKLI